MELVLRLDHEPDAVPAARRFIAESLRGTAGEHLTRDAELVVAELATNALMYAGQPVTVRILITDDVVRVEVIDASRSAPLRGAARPGDMTGRGLALINAVSHRWGVVPLAAGKLVWAELGTEPAEPDYGQRPDRAVSVAGQWPNRDVGSTHERYTIALGDVPTTLLLEAKAHVDNLVREFTLAAAGAATGTTPEVSPHLAQLIKTVTTRFAEARQSIKQQAIAAAAAGLERTRLELTVPIDAAEAGRDYLRALDEADAYARAARLLTLESPPQHRAFRRWYVASLVDQLQTIGRGEEPTSPPSFEQYLLGELGAVATAQRAADRSSRLQTVTAALARSSTVEEVASVVVLQGVTALGASGGGLLVPVDDDHLAVPGAVGYGEELVQRLRSERRDAMLPAAVALRTGDPVWLESREERDARFPALTGLEPATVSMCAVPLVTSDRVLGALRFGFDLPRLFDEDERRFVLALAAQTAQALDRIRIHEAERAARTDAETAMTRLSRLHHVTASLAGASDVREIADIVAKEAADTLGAELSALCVLEGQDTLRVLGLHGAQPSTLERWQTFSVAADLPASEAVRTNRPVVARTRAELEARFPLLGRIDSERSLACVPVSAGDRRLGALALSFAPDHVIDDAELDLLTTIGRQCGLALERAQLFDAERLARERSSFLADAAAVLTSSLEPAETLRHLTDLIVPALADWSVVYLADESGRIEVATASHRDPKMTGLMLQLRGEESLGIMATDGLGDALKAGRSVLYTHVPDSIRSDIDDRLRDTPLHAALALDSALAVPLIARGRVLGALALARGGTPSYTTDDLLLVEDIAARAAVAVDNAEQFRRERDAALTLQRSLLPQHLPQVAGVSFAWRYLPGAAGTHIGGDWYDVIPLERGRVALVIGDVMGRGLQAAAVMGQLRATARAHASIDVGPAAVLARLDAALARLEQDQITTALFGVLDPLSRSLTVASAGHLPPLVSAARGSAYYLDVVPGPPLGVGDASYPELHTVLPESSTLLLFTDGLVEDRQLPVDVGMETLRTAVAHADGPERLCELALAALGRDIGHDDDTALLAVGFAAG